MSRLTAILFVLFDAPLGHAADWPQWMGPNRDAVWSETGIVEKLPEKLKVEWRAPVA